MAFETNHPDVPSIHFYEYYWGHVPQWQITAIEVLEWASQVARGAKGFYNRTKEQMSQK